MPWHDMGTAYSKMILACGLVWRKLSLRLLHLYWKTSLEPLQFEFNCEPNMSHIFFLIVMLFTHLSIHGDAISLSAVCVYSSAESLERVYEVVHFGTRLEPMSGSVLWRRCCTLPAAPPPAWIQPAGARRIGILSLCRSALCCHHGSFHIQPR